MPAPVTPPPRWAVDLSDVDTPGAVTTPPASKQTSGWLTNEAPPSQFVNWFFRGVYRWLQYLQNLTSEVLVWAEQQTFNKGVLVTNVTNSAAVLATASGTGTAVQGVAASTGIAVRGTGGNVAVAGVASANNALSAVWGLSQPGSSAVGVLGSGAAAPAGNSTGTAGGSFAGGPALLATGSGRGGAGLISVGGSATASAPGHQNAGDGARIEGGSASGSGAPGNTVSAGDGGVVLGGSVDGATIDSGAAGVGLRITGGSVNVDANNRRGGSAVVLTGGVGQAGPGAAAEITQGDVELDAGSRVIYPSGRLRSKGFNAGDFVARVGLSTPWNLDVPATPLYPPHLGVVSQNINGFPLYAHVPVNLPLGAVITSIEVGVEHSGSGTNSLQIFAQGARVSTGAGVSTFASVIPSAALALSVGASAQHLGTTLTAVVADRTKVQDTESFVIAFRATASGSVTVKFNYLVVSYFMFEVV